LACGHCFGAALRRCETWTTEVRIFLPYDSSLKAEQTTMTPKPRTNFTESPSQLSFACSGPLCLRSSLESSSDYHIGLGLVLALAFGSVKRAPSSHIVGKPHSGEQRGTERSVHKVSSVLVQLDFPRRKNFLHLHLSLSNFPDLSRYNMLMPAFVQRLHGQGIGPRVSYCRHYTIPFAPTKTAGLEARRSCCFNDDPATRLSRQTRASLHSALRYREIASLTILNSPFVHFGASAVRVNTL